MENTNGVTIKSNVDIVECTNELRLTKAFAEKYLSKSALKFARKTDTHYVYILDRTAFIVIFELPSLFNLNFGEVLRWLINYCFPYMQENNLNDDVTYTKYIENSKKPIDGGHVNVVRCKSPLKFKVCCRDIEVKTLNASNMEDILEQYVKYCNEHGFDTCIFSTDSFGCSAWQNKDEEVLILVSVV